MKNKMPDGYQVVEHLNPTNKKGLSRWGYHWVGRSLGCPNETDSSKYRKHRLKTAYIRKTVYVKYPDGKYPVDMRTMQKVGYYCETCEQFWTAAQIENEKSK
jgi:hypothetical protein